jgi:spermidine synthase
MRTLAGIGLSSAATLLLQVTLTRLFSIAQFYHFAFLVVSLALLGFGASGSLLAVWPRLRSRVGRPLYALGFGVTALTAYAVLNRWSFDSYAIAWDRQQVWWLLLDLFCLAIPFTFAGALTGAVLADSDLPVGSIYGANMIGSAGGAGLTPILLATLGDERIIVLCATLSAAAGLLLSFNSPPSGLLSSLILLGCLVGFVYPPGSLKIQPSSYKPLSHYRRNPDAVIETPRYNAYSRLDIIHSPTIHSAPGLSMSYLGALPPEVGLLIDGDNLLPIPQAELTAPEFAAAMPASAAFGLYENPDVLVLGAGGGLDVSVALLNGAKSVVAVEPNSLIADVLRDDLLEWNDLAADPRVDLIHREIRTYARQRKKTFDIVQLSLRDAYRPITSGAFTLTEDYEYTIEAFRAYLDLLDADGILIVTRWLQNPPSEEVRTLGLIAAALETGDRDPPQHIVAFRSFQTVTFLVKRAPFDAEEVAMILAEAERLKYDMVLAPELPIETVNRYARLAEPEYYNTFNALLNAPDRNAFYQEYDFDVRPPTDDRPFFFHFFKWSQTPEVLDNLGRTWQPFGGSGYFVLIALLIFAVLAALVFVILPIILSSRFRRAVRSTSARYNLRVFTYFGCLGLAYLLIEISMIQQFVLVLGQPTLAIAAILTAMLLFSGLGSLYSARLPWHWALTALTMLVLIWPWVLDVCAALLLVLPLSIRLLLSVLLLAPLSTLMGIPMARGLAILRDKPDLIPWAWAINGGASVISAVLAPLLALSVGFTWVLLAGGLFYGIAWLSRPVPAPV